MEEEARDEKNHPNRDSGPGRNFSCLPIAWLGGVARNDRAGAGLILRASLHTWISQLAVTVSLDSSSEPSLPQA